MAQLSAYEIYEIARGAGFNPDQAVTMTAIALAESGGRTDAHNPNGEDSRGLWQINWDAHAGAGWARGLDPTDLNDPRVNAIAAYHVSRSGADIRPWTVTHRDNIGHYPHYADPRYRDPAIQAAIDHGDLTADGNFHGPANYRSAPVPAGDGMSTGTPVMPYLGHDSDGQDTVPLAHSTASNDTTANQIIVPGFDDHPADDAWRLDSDHDGLSDGAEWLLRTDAHAADTDHDGIGDRDELGLDLHPRVHGGDLDDHPDALEGWDPLQRDAGDLRAAFDAVLAEDHHLDPPHHL